MCNNTKKMLIVGNGLSRLAYKKEIQDFKGEVWIFNFAFREEELLKKATRWSGHEELIQEAKEYQKKGKFKIWGKCKRSG